MSLAKIFIAFILAIAALAIVTIILKLGYKILNRTFGHAHHDEVMEKLRR